MRSSKDNGSTVKEVGVDEKAREMIRLLAEQLGYTFTGGQDGEEEESRGKG